MSVLKYYFTYFFKLFLKILFVLCVVLTWDTLLISINMKSFTVAAVLHLIRYYLESGFFYVGYGLASALGFIKDFRLVFSKIIDLIAPYLPTDQIVLAAIELKEELNLATAFVSFGWVMELITGFEFYFPNIKLPKIVTTLFCFVIAYKKMPLLIKKTQSKFGKEIDMETLDQKIKEEREKQLEIQKQKQNKQN